MAGADRKRTGFSYDLTPWKVQVCDGGPSCKDFGPLRISQEFLPPAPEPGRLPASWTHVHIVPKLSGDRDARDEEKWRAIAFSAGRCEHGRVQGDPCVSCPGGWSPDRSGTRVGTAYDGTPVVVPPREEWIDIRAWTPGRYARREEDK